MELLIHHKYFFLMSFFAIVFLGMSSGKLKIKGVGLGPSMVVFVSIFFGAIGVSFPSIILQLGIAIFIFSIGIQAGPSFFQTIKKEGNVLVLVTAALIFFSVCTLYSVGYLLGVSPEYLLGVLSGALTSTPGLAAAVESSSNSSAIFGYSVAYPFGVIGVILFIRLLPKLFSTTIEEEEESLLASYRKKDRLHANYYQVKNQNIDGMTLQQLLDTLSIEVTISRLITGNEVTVPSSKSIFKLGDTLKVVGTSESLQKVELLVGPTVECDAEISDNYLVKNIVVTNKRVVGKTIRQINIVSNFNARVTRVQRNGVELFPHSKMKLRYGDSLVMIIPSEKDGELVRFLGAKPNSLSDDFIVLAVGVIFGILLGIVSVPIFGNAKFSLGLSGGVLLSAILLGHFGKIGTIICHLSSSTNKVLRELGIILFFIGVGTQAGNNLSSIDLSLGLKSFVVGILVTIIPMVGITIFLRKVYKMNLVKLVGIISGGMTSTPALASISSQMKTDFATAYYAAVYPFALAFLIVAIKLSDFISR